MHKVQIPARWQILKGWIPTGFLNKEQLIPSWLGFGDQIIHVISGLYAVSDLGPAVSQKT